MILSGNGINCVLPDDLEWIDEFTWTHTKEDVKTTLTGDIIITTSKLNNGRHITLQGGSDYAWIDKNTLTQLQKLLNSATNMVLTYKDGRQFNVVFRYSDGAIDYKSIYPNIEQYNNLIIRLREV